MMNIVETFDKSKLFEGLKKTTDAFSFNQETLCNVLQAGKFILEEPYMTGYSLTKDCSFIRVIRAQIYKDDTITFKMGYLTSAGDFFEDKKYQKLVTNYDESNYLLYGLHQFSTPQSITYLIFMEKNFLEATQSLHDNAQDIFMQFNTFYQKSELDKKLSKNTTSDTCVKI